MKARYIERIETSEAEKLANKRLDRRRVYGAFVDRAPCSISGRKVMQIERWTDTCTGCTEYGDYGTQYGPFGCEECGYTGKRRVWMWVPID